LCKYSEQQYADKQACIDDRSSFSTVATSVSGVNDDGEYVFFDSEGKIIPVTDATVPTIGYKYASSGHSLTQIDSEDYYFNKYNSNGAVQLYQYYVDESAGKYLFKVISTGANQAYVSGEDLILCTGVKNCQKILKSELASKVGGRFFVNSDDPTQLISILSGEIDTDENELAIYDYFVYEMGDLDGIIDCHATSASRNCTIHEVIPRDVKDPTGIYASEGYYLGAGYNGDASLQNTLIYCTSDYGCVNQYSVISPPTLNTVTEAYFVNSGASKTETPIIKCDKSSTPTYTLETGVANAYYVNTGSEINKPLIHCESETSCEAVQADENNYYLSFDNNLIAYTTKWVVDDTTTGYVINSGTDKYDHPLIYCTGKDPSCSTVAAATGGYYMYKSSTNSLIHCATEHSCTVINNVEDGYYLNNNEDDKPLIYCASDSSCVPVDGVQGYFLDQSTYSNNKYYGLIYCSSTTECSAVSFFPGFYVNSGADDGQVIECQTSCISKPANTCSEASEKITIPAGSYCYDENTISFVYETFELNSTRSSLDESEVEFYLINVDTDEDAQANYAYTTVNADVFPGITSTLSTLFKVTQHSIVQVIEDGVVAINTKTKIRMTNYAESTTLNSKIALYHCESSNIRCIPINSCSSKMYIYDAGSAKGLYCNGSNLNSITTPGYYLDGSRKVNGKTPYVLDCDASGNCTSLTPSNVYMLNAGYNNDTNKLIYCGYNSCSTVVAAIGYYLPYDKKGIIQCTSPTKCAYQNVSNFRYYINTGAINTSKILIQCYNSNCNIVVPNIGYYITHSPSILINCTSRSQCSEISVSDGYYSSGYKGTPTTKYIIRCINIAGNINCGMEATSVGAYVSNNSNILVICDENDCNTVEADIGTYISASSTYASVKVKRNEEGIDMIVPENHLHKRSSHHSIITCDAESCKELSPAELALIPICKFNSNRCFISYDYSLTSLATTSVSAGGYCTNAERSKLYFATDSIEVESNVIGSTTSTFLYTTTNSNCIEVSKAFKSYYYTFGSNIYHLDDNRITLVVKKGYYFINVIDNTLATGRTIDEYNNIGTKIYKCNGSACTTIDKLKTDSYFADVNKKIIKYTAETKTFSFPYSRDIVCIYDNNSCTPKYDMEKREFCITYLGELVLATRDIPSRETAPCYRSKDIDSNIYGFSQYLYKMDSYSAVMVANTSYHIVTKTTNYTAEFKDYSNKPKNIVIYGCIKKNCDMYEPRERVYYYDSSNKSMYRLVDGVWSAPSKGGYAYISISPLEVYVYKFSIKNNSVILESKVSTGFYHTVDKEMYECTNTDCQPITDSGYVFTNNGEIYYCEYDSEELEETVCKIQSCITGQYYYIDGYYYRCDSGSVLNLMTSKYCVYSAKYVINFPTILSNDYPSKVRYAVDKIARNNHSTATYKRGRNYLPVVPAVYTNCTYNFEDKEPNFDLVCVNNYVTVTRNDETEICSIGNMGYVYCSDDSDNPNKCNPSSAYHILSNPILHILIAIITAFIYFYYL